MNVRLWVAIPLVLLVGSSLFVSPVVSQPLSEVAADTTVTVDRGSSDFGGNETVIVQLTDHPDPEIEAMTHEDRIDTMKAHAADSRSAFRRFANNSPHVAIHQEFWLTNALLVTVETDHVPLRRLGTVDNVEEIHENHRVNVTTTTPEQLPTSRTTTAPNTPERETALPQVTATTADHTLSTATAPDNFTRALELINLPPVLERGNGGDGVRVAVLDTGVTPHHPDIEINDDDWACYVDCVTAGPHDVDGHGTHVSGTIVGGNANDAGLQIGVAPNATLMHAKVLDDSGGGNYHTVVRGTQWAVENNADVISMSFGGEAYNDDFVELIRNAQAGGTVVVAAIGNGGAGTSSSPANVYDAISVGSVNVEPSFPQSRDFGLTDDTVPVWSGGERIDSSDWPSPPSDWPESYVVPDVTAPGAVIWSADANLSHVSPCGGLRVTVDLSCQQGTSMATPHVAGTVALMLANSNVDRSPSEIQAALQDTAVDIGDSERRQGAGRIDTYEAVATLATQPNITVTITDAPTEVTAGENLTVDYTIENTGIGAGRQPIDFEINGTVVDTHENIELNTSETKGGTFTHQTRPTETGTLSVTVKSEDNSDSRNVIFTEPTAVDQRTLTATVSESLVAANESTPVVVTVTDNQTRTPIEGATVSAPALGVSNSTDSDGTAVLVINATPGEYSIRVDSRGYRSSETAVTVVADQGRRDAVYEPGSAAAEFDADENGRISIRELGSAGAAYANQTLSISELANVGAAYAASGG